MRRIRLLISSALVALFFVVVQFQSEAHHETVKREEGTSAEKLRPGCHRHYRQHTFWRYTKRRYTRRSSPLTSGQKLHVKHLALCLANKRKSHWAYERKRHWRAAFRQRLAYYRLTPYAGPNGTRWAIPWYIVACESGGSWGAYNPSGAVGPYQLLGWGAIYPARTWAAKMQNHRIASRLWAGGAGASNWVCA